MTFLELWESPPAFNILDKIKIGEGIYEVISVDAAEGDSPPNGMIGLRPCEGTRFIRDEDDPDSEADYYRVPLSILKAAKPLVAKYQPPLFS